MMQNDAKNRPPLHVSFNTYVITPSFTNMYDTFFAKVARDVKSMFTFEK